MKRQLPNIFQYEPATRSVTDWANYFLRLSLATVLIHRDGLCVLKWERKKVSPQTKLILNQADLQPPRVPLIQICSGES
jgi:hypothetical protein